VEISIFFEFGFWVPWAEHLQCHSALDEFTVGAGSGKLEKGRDFARNGKNGLWDFAN